MSRGISNAGIHMAFLLQTTHTEERGIKSARKYEVREGGEERGILRECGRKLIVPLDTYIMDWTAAFFHMEADVKRRDRGGGIGN
jgi:hypothetical protein